MSLEDSSVEPSEAGGGLSFLAGAVISCIQGHPVPFLCLTGVKLGSNWDLLKLPHASPTTSLQLHTGPGWIWCMSSSTSMADSCLGAGRPPPPPPHTHHTHNTAMFDSWVKVGLTQNTRAGTGERGGETSTTRSRAPEFVLVSPDRPPPVADVVQPLAAAGHVADVPVLQDGEAEDVLQQLARQVGELLVARLGGNPIEALLRGSGYRRRHLFCLPTITSLCRPRPLMAQGAGPEAGCAARGGL